MGEPRSCGSINAEIARVKRAKAARRGKYRPSKKQAQKPIQGPASDEFLETFEWRRVRMLALKKYGPRCQCCGATSQTAQIHVDHIKPRKLFPQLALSLDNLQILCHECNHGKGNWDMTDWRSNAPQEVTQ